MLSSNVKTLGVEAAKQVHNEGTDRSSFPDQEEGITMFSMVGQKPQKFDTTFTIAIGTDGLAVVQPNDDGTVTIAFNDVAAVVPPTVALSLAAAIQSVAVHALEQTEAVAH